MIIRNEQFSASVCVAADVVDLDAGTWSREERGVIVEGPRALTDAEWLAYDPPPADGDVIVDRWTIPADNATAATITVGCDEPVAWFVVDGTVVDVAAERGRAVLEIVAAAPGAVDVRWRDRQVTILGVAP